MHLSHCLQISYFILRIGTKFNVLKIGMGNLWTLFALHDISHFYCIKIPNFADIQWLNRSQVIFFHFEDWDQVQCSIKRI